MPGPKARGPDDVGRVSSMDQAHPVDTLLAWQRDWVGYVFMMELQVIAFRKCTLMISLHIATILMSGFMTGLLWPQSYFSVTPCVVRY